MFIFKTWVLLPKASASERVTFCLVWNSMCQYSCYAHGNFLLNGKYVFRKCCSEGKCIKQTQWEAGRKSCNEILLQNMSAITLHMLSFPCCSIPWVGRYFIFTSSGIKYKWTYSAAWTKCLDILRNFNSILKGKKINKRHYW